MEIFCDDQALGFDFWNLYHDSQFQSINKLILGNNPTGIGSLDNMRSIDILGVTDKIFPVCPGVYFGLENFGKVASWSFHPVDMVSRQLAMA